MQDKEINKKQMQQKESTLMDLLDSIYTPTRSNLVKRYTIPTYTLNGFNNSNSSNREE